MKAILQAQSMDEEFEGEFHLVRDESILGRGALCDLVIPRKTVSKQHARFVRAEDKYLIEDLGSRSGVYVNSAKVQKQALADGDKIIVGDVLIHYHVEGGAPRPAAADGATAQPEASEITGVGMTREFSPEDVRARLKAAAAALPSADKPPPAPRAAVPAAGAGPDADDVELAPSSPFAKRKGGGRHRKGPDPANDPYTKLRAEIHGLLVRRPELRRDVAENIPDDEMWNKAKVVANQIIFQLQQEGRIPSTVNPKRLLKDILQDALGLGPIQDFLSDPSIEEIMVNGPYDIFIARRGKTVKADVTFIDEEKLLTAINRITAPLGRTVNQSRPMVDARLADGSRINAIIPPVSLVGPVLTIRKFPEKPLTPKDLMAKGSASEGMFEFLRFAVEKHKNIMVAGGTAAGKTTLLNVMSSFIPSDERILTIEDSAELQLQQPHVISLETRPTTSDQAMNVDIRLLVKNALRMRPDRIIVGECRGAEALDMLQAMNTGHDGSLTTGHANSARDMLTRLETMVMMAGMEIPLYAIREQVARALDVVVFVQRFPDGVRRISEVIEVVGMVDDNYDAHEVFRFNYQIGEDGAIKGSFDPTGYIPEFMREIKERGGDVPLEIFSPQPVF